MLTNDVVSFEQPGPGTSLYCNIYFLQLPLYTSMSIVPIKDYCTLRLFTAIISVYLRAAYRLPTELPIKSKSRMGSCFSADLVTRGLSHGDTTQVALQ